MAGIGFELRRLGRQQSLLAPVAMMGHAAIVAAGPWIVTMVAMMAIGWLCQEQSRAVTTDFRVATIYAFALSQVITAPIVIVATRMLADALYARRLGSINPLFQTALVAAALATTVLTPLVLGGLFGASAATVLTGTLCCSLVGMIWVSLAFCGAVRDVGAITAAFIAGLLVAVAATTLAARRGLAGPGMVLGFCSGLAVILFGLMARVLATFPQQAQGFQAAMRNFAAGIVRYRVLALGGLAAYVAIWIDKWVFWGGPAGEQAPNGLTHAPIYDSAMFIAYLAIVPALALFVASIETEFFDKYRRFYIEMSHHATLGQIRRNGADLEATAMRMVTSVAVVQATLCTIVALSAPVIVAASGLSYSQTAILRLGAVSALFQFLFLSCASLLLFFARDAMFLALQTLLLVLQGALAAATLALGSEYYGFGSVLACVACSLLAFFALERTIRDIGFLTFIVGNHRKAVIGQEGSSP